MTSNSTMILQVKKLLFEVELINKIHMDALIAPATYVTTSHIFKAATDQNLLLLELN